MELFVLPFLSEAHLLLANCYFQIKHLKVCELRRMGKWQWTNRKIPRGHHCYSLSTMPGNTSGKNCRGSHYGPYERPRRI